MSFSFFLTQKVKKGWPMFFCDALELHQAETCMVRNFLLEIYTGESQAQL